MSAWNLWGKNLVYTHFSSLQTLKCFEFEMNSVWPKWSRGENRSFFWFVCCYTVFLLHYLFVITDILWMIGVKRWPFFSRSWEFPSRLFPDPTGPLTQQLEALNYDQVHVPLCLSAHCNLRILCHLCQFQLQVPSMQMSRSPIENHTIIFNKFIQYLEKLWEWKIITWFMAAANRME